jgi:serralysin
VGRSGKLGSSAFWASTSGRAHDKDDRIIYDKDSGWLYYDPDGIGSTASVIIARLKPNLKLSESDFYVA